jgi:zinc protease
MLDRTIAPPFAKEFSFQLPEPEIISLANGSSIVWIKDLAQNVVKIDLVMKAGKWYEPSPGIAHFAISMLEKGTKNQSSEKIAEVFDFYGAQIELAAGPDFASLSIYSLTHKLEHILPIVMAMLSEPSFPEEELEQMKLIFVENLRVNLEKNSYLASKLLKQNIFGANHPYGSSLDIDQVDTITPEKLHAFSQKQFRPFEIYVTGALSKNQMDTLVTIFSTLGAEKKNDLPRTINENTSLEQKVEKPGSVQTSLRLGMQTIGRNHADYFQLLLLNHLLGGYFGSRLMKNIREEKGLTYGIYSSVTAHLHASLFSIGTDVNNEKTSLTIQEIKKEVEKIRQEKIGEQELEVARNHFLGALQLELSNPFSVTEKIKNIRLNELPSDYYARLSQTVSLATPETLQSVANALLVWDSFHQIAVG